MALNLSFLNNLVSSAPVSPKVFGPVTAGGVVGSIIAVFHQYAPSVTLPSAPTMIFLVTALMGAVGYLLPHSGTAPKSASPAPVAPDPAAPAEAPAAVPAAPPAGA